MKTKLTLIALAVCAPLAAFAQFGDFETGASKPWASFKLPKKTLKLDFKNASIDMVISLFSKSSGITIVKDPALKDPITLSTAKAVNLNDAFEVLNAALGLRNFEMRKDGNLLIIKAKQASNRGGASGFTMSPDMLQGLGGGNSSLQLKVYPIKYANASQVARVLNDVFQQSGGGGIQLPFGFGGGNFGNRGGGRRGGGLTFGGGSQGPNVRASSDDYSNTVIVNAPKNDQRQVEDLIKEIDKPADEAVKPIVYQLKFASSDDLQSVVNNILIANAPKGRGGSTSNTPVDRQFTFPFFGGGGNNQNRNQGAVVSEPRTNALIVTTTEENQKLVAQVIKDLDTQIKVESTTFVFPLDNARADQVATLMRQAFGTRQGTNAGFTQTNQGRTQNSTQNRNNTNNGRLGNGNNGGGLNLGGSNTSDPNDLALELADPNANYGELQTNIAAQGGGIFGQLFGGGNQNNQNRNQNARFGRNAQGQIVPIQDLTGQVTVIPDTNTNSLIVVTSPENAALLREILAQLDRIPEQVMIETIIVEASLTAEDKLGVEWKFTQAKAFGNSGTTGTVENNLGVQASNPQGFRYTLAGGNLGAFINALKTDTKFQVLSTPRIFTSNNVEAEINISQRVPYVTSQRTDTNGNITYNYAFEDVGIVLNVTPRITANGYVTMDVLQTANDLQGFTSFNAPIINQRQAETTVAVKDADTIILGGIIRSTVSSTVKKIPVLGDIPILGNLFKSTDRTKAKTELLVFLTPHVVRNPDDAAKLREKEQTKLSKASLDAVLKSLGLPPSPNNPPKEGGH